MEETRDGTERGAGSRHARGAARQAGSGAVYGGRAGGIGLMVCREYVQRVEALGQRARGRCEVHHLGHGIPIGLRAAHERRRGP